MKPKILVVEDDEQILFNIKLILEMNEYEPITATNGEEALEVVKKERPHIVLLDIIMPKMDGIECLKRIKEIDKEVGVIMITAVKQEEVGKQALKLGAFDYITKPLSLQYLEDCLMVKLFQMTA